jgi:hypothetical protein
MDNGSLDCSNESTQRLIGELVSALLLLIVLAVVSGVTILVVVILAALRGRPAPAGPAVARAARRHEAVVSTTATLVSAAATLAILMAPSMPLSTGHERRTIVFALGSATAPYLAVVMFCLVRALGERTWPRPRGAVRTAPLVRRTLRDTGGWRLTVLAATVGTGLLAVLVYGATATPDGQRVARTVVAADGGIVGWASAGPYPGSHYGPAIGVGLLAVAAAVLLSLRAVTRRPPLPHLPTGHDDAVRRVAAARLLAGAQLWTGLGVGLTMLVAANPLHGTGHVVGATASAVVGGGMLIGSMVVAATAVPAPRAHRTDAAGAAWGGVPA